MRKSFVNIIRRKETKKTAKDTRERKTYIHNFRSVPRKDRATSGVPLAIRSRHQTNIKSWNQISDRVGVFYAPNDDTRDGNKSFFLRIGEIN